MSNGGSVELRSISLLGQYALTEVEVPRLLRCLAFWCSGILFFHTFLDDYSRKLWAYAIGHKSEVFGGRQRPLQKTLTTRGGGDQAEGRSTGRGQATEGQPRRGRGCEARSKSSISDFIANEIENEG
ncbi:BZ3500_MvSof-1268-A1-R1_C036g00027 [Microbotryum saponariae]|uniref:BZ3500_MvSof-1268-A1-R1_C036g00027 protein n=1 Tax=Microbotryum saponariae TaxID=289078 RepID=A0A2X0NRM7_9BASI|nr:BZ3501_MvSof-1269-A2-R1_C42g00204 [Microbotryum saponariae]SDA02177.1 BZ3500_MvSof-1268-A1-R1_C036g00027 [Microbotryum saponariae]SDA08487.1 BZ3501_MvSof-1269-A2-R1_C34g00133 [Microbotryum saponariae]